MKNELEDDNKTGILPDLKNTFATYYTQAAERHFKGFTDASKSVCSKELREGYIQTRLESRNKMSKLSKYTTKSDWKS